MKADVFISYSRKDLWQALELVGRLKNLGISAWMDQHGIQPAASWLNEIVEAIESCKALVVLISPSSIASDNVARELSLALESKKTIVPVELGAVELPTQFRYQLAGIQRVAISNFEGILQALGSVGLSGDAASEAEYYKTQFEALSQEHLRCDFSIRELRQRLSHSDQSLRALNEFSSCLERGSTFLEMLEPAIDALHRSLMLDRCVAYVRSSAPDSIWSTYVPVASRGYGGVTVLSPIDIATSLREPMIANSMTPDAALRRTMALATQTPYFVAVPFETVSGDGGLLFGGRLEERSLTAPRLSDRDAEAVQLFANQIKLHVRLTHAAANAFGSG